jgi:hypothetical protein
MRQGWWRFWSGRSWRQWTFDRLTWRAHAQTSSELRQQRHLKNAELAAAKEFAADAREAWTWIQAMGPTATPFELRQKEFALASVGGVTLQEKRVGEGNEAWITVGVGTIHLTDHRAVFDGERGMMWWYRDLKPVTLEPKGVHLEITRRSTEYLLSGASEKLHVLIAACKSVAEGVDPLAVARRLRFDADTLIDEVETELREVNERIAALDLPVKPMSPASSRPWQ